MIIKILDINKRLKSLSESADISSTLDYVYNKALNGDVNSIFTCLEQWQRIPGINEEDKGIKAIELFDKILESGSAGQVRKAITIFNEKVSMKARTPEQFKNYISRKLGWITRKSNIEGNKVGKAADLDTSIQNIASKIGIAAANNTVSDTRDNNTVQKESAYNEILECVNKVIHTDRIITNYENVSKRFNIDKVISESYYDGIEDTTLNVCKLIDTYNTNDYVKLNTVMETVWYAYNKLGYNDYNINEMVDTACNYFMNKENGHQVCKTVLDASIIVDPYKLKSLNYIMEEEPDEEDQLQENMRDNIYSYVTEADGKILTPTGDRTVKGKTDYGDAREITSKRIEDPNDATSKLIFNPLKYAINSTKNYDTNPDNVANGDVISGRGEYFARSFTDALKHNAVARKNLHGADIKDDFGTKAKLDNRIKVGDAGVARAGSFDYLDDLMVTSPELVDIEKLKKIAEENANDASIIVQDYNDIVDGQIDRIINSYNKRNMLRLSKKAYNRDRVILSCQGIEDTIKNFRANGGKKSDLHEYLKQTYFPTPYKKDSTGARVIDTDAIKDLCASRVNYISAKTDSLIGAINYNYQALNISKFRAKLMLGHTPYSNAKDPKIGAKDLSINSINRIRDAIEKNPGAFIKDNKIDFTSVGGGIYYFTNLPNFMLKTKDKKYYNYLSNLYIQSLNMNYILVVDTKDSVKTRNYTSPSGINVTVNLSKMKELLSKIEVLANKYAKKGANIKLKDCKINPRTTTTNGNNSKNNSAPFNIVGSYEPYFNVLEAINGINPDPDHHTSASLAIDKQNLIDLIIDNRLAIEKHLISFDQNNDNTTENINIVKNIRSKIPTTTDEAYEFIDAIHRYQKTINAKFTKNGEYKVWNIFPINIDGTTYEDCNDAVRAILQKEAGKDRPVNIAIATSNKEKLTVDEDIKKDGVTIFYPSDASIMKEAVISSYNDDTMFYDIECDLRSICNENGISYDDDEYLYMCEDFIIESSQLELYEFFNEEGTFSNILSKIGNAFKVAISAIVSIIKHGFALIKEVIKHISGDSVSDPDNQEKLPEPFEYTYISCNGGKLHKETKMVTTIKEMEDIAQKEINDMSNIMRQNNEELKELQRKQKDVEAEAVADMKKREEKQTPTELTPTSAENTENNQQQVLNNSAFIIYHNNPEFLYESKRDKFKDKNIKNVDFNKIFNDFKKESDKETKLGGLIKAMFSDTPENIIINTGNILHWIRAFLVIGSFALMGPIVGAVTLIADQTTSILVSKKQGEKMLEAFTKEKEDVEAKMKKTDDPEVLDRLKEYKYAIEYGIIKIQEYLDDQLTNNELSDKYSAKEDKETSEEELSESDLEVFSLIHSIVNEMKIDEYINFNEAIEKNIDKIPNDLILSISEFSSKFDILDRNEFKSLLESELTKFRIGYKDYPIIEKYNRINTYKDAIIILSETQNIPESLDIYDSYTLITTYNTLNEMLISINDDSNLIMEASVDSYIKAGSERMKSGLQKLSDKEREASKQLDASTGRFMQGLRRLFTTNNREAIIKGTICPSASQALKILLLCAGLSGAGAVAAKAGAAAAGAAGLGKAATVLGVLKFPVLAIISTMAFVICSKRFKNKERQLILDEIEVELQIVEKEINENSDDKKTLRELLTIKRTLERERQRIQYNMHVIGQHTVPASNTNTAYSY